MKLDEIRKLSPEALDEKIAGTYRELLDARLKHARHQLENRGVLRQLRHVMAQLKTVRAEKQRQLQEV